MCMVTSLQPGFSGLKCSAGKLALGARNIEEFRALWLPDFPWIQRGCLSPVQVLALESSRVRGPAAAIKIEKGTICDSALPACASVSWRLRCCDLHACARARPLTTGPDSPPDLALRR